MLLSQMDRPARIKRMVMKLPKAYADQLDQQDALEITDDVIFTTFRISASTIVVASSIHTQTIPAQTLELFQYGIKGGPTTMQDVGFPIGAPYDRATYSDTNLLNGGQTNNSEVFGIEAVSLTINPISDAEMIKRCMPLLSFSFSFNSVANAKRLGKSHRMGASGGFWGGGETRLQTPDTTGQKHSIPGFIQNGAPADNGGYDLQDCLVWGPSSVPGIRQNISLTAKLERQVVIMNTVRTPDAAVPITAYTPPVAQSAPSDNEGTFIEIVAELRGLRIAPPLGI